MSGTQKSFAERIAQIEKTKAPAVETPDVTTAQKIRMTAPDVGRRAASTTMNVLAVAVLIPSVLGATLLFGGESVRTAFGAALVSGFGEVKDTETSAETRYEWDTKPTPFNAARLGMKRMNAFAQDMSDMEMDALVRQAQNLGQPFLANEIKARMGACETLKCRAALQSEYEAQLAQLRRSTPNW